MHVLGLANDEVQVISLFSTVCPCVRVLRKQNPLLITSSMLLLSVQRDLSINASQKPTTTITT